MLLQDLTVQIVAGCLPFIGPDVGTPFASKVTGTDPAEPLLLLLLAPLPLPLPFPLGWRAAMVLETIDAIVAGSMPCPIQVIPEGVDPWCTLNRALAEASRERMRSLCLTRRCRRCQAGSTVVAPNVLSAVCTA